MLRLHRALVLVAGTFACARPSVPAVGARAQPAAVPAALSASSVLREVDVVRVGSTDERWSLVWLTAPRSACGPEEPDLALSCPCIGFAYGEMGQLDLVRSRPGRPDERLALTPLFHEAGADGPPGVDSLAVLQRWPVQDSDYAAADDDSLPSAIRARPVTRVMVLSDYDHDGAPTEFLLKVGTLPCGKQEAVLVGVSRADSSLHVFRSIGHPERPLVLPTYIWDRLLRSNGRATGVEWACWDHGADTQTEVSLSAGPAGIDGTRYEYACTIGKGKARLLSSARI